MEPKIMNDKKAFKLYGCSKHHDESKSYGEEIVELLDRVWAEVRVRNLSGTGINHVVYDGGNVLFAGIELTSPIESDTTLVKKEYRFTKYAYCTHLGPYSRLGEAHSKMRSAIEALGQQHVGPVIEIYGHWEEDESKLQTEILYTLK